MARTHEKVRYTPNSKPEKLTPVTAAQGVENALKILEGRWKLVILFHLFGGKVLRFLTWNVRSRRFPKRCSSSNFAGWRPMASSNASSTLKFHRKSNTSLRRGGRNCAR